MSKDLRFPDPAPDRELAAALAPLLTPPDDSVGYWNTLERRVMARIESAPAWWFLTPSTLRAGMAAAGLALLALGALALQTRSIEARLAYRAVTETPLEVAAPIPGIDPRPSRYAEPPATLPPR
jgi:hypothetical protein